MLKLTVEFALLLCFAGPKQIHADEILLATYRNNEGGSLLVSDKTNKKTDVN